MISRQTALRIRWLFRYSMSRDAYILRGVGGWVGPVFKVRDPAAGALPEEPGPDE
jgi:hypothetical protein